MRKGGNTKVCEILTFKVKGVYCGIKTNTIITIARQLDITDSVGNVPDYIKGSIVYSGDVITLIDLSKYLGIRGTENSGNEEIMILCAAGDYKVALLTSEISKIFPITNNEILECSSIISDRTYILDGYIHKDEKLIAILNIGIIVDDLVKQNQLSE